MELDKVHLLKKCFFLANGDRVLLSIISTLVYNLISKDIKKRKILVSIDGTKILQFMLRGIIVNKFVAEDDAFDWIYFTYLSLFYDDLLSDIWNLFDCKEDDMVTDNQVILLQLYSATINKSKDDEFKCRSLITPNSISLLAKEFSKICERTQLSQILENKENYFYSNDVESMLQLIQIFSNVTELQLEIGTLFNEGILKIIINLLQKEFQLEKELKLKNPEMFYKNLTTFGIKKEFIKVIGNICFRNHQAQNQVMISLNPTNR